MHENPPAIAALEYQRKSSRVRGGCSVALIQKCVRTAVSCDVSKHAHSVRIESNSRVGARGYVLEIFGDGWLCSGNGLHCRTPKRRVGRVLGRNASCIARVVGRSPSLSCSNHLCFRSPRLHTSTAGKHQGRNPGLH